jgi:hypothetical protein
MAESGGITLAAMITSGKYRFLHKYLDERYANTVVLSFGQIEDLLGFALPPPARTDPDWWTRGADAGWSDVWRLAHRTAKPNLPARHVVFERVATVERSAG